MFSLFKLYFASSRKPRILLFASDNTKDTVEETLDKEEASEEDEGGGKRDDDDSGEGGETKSPSIETSNKNKADRKERFSRGWESGAPGRPGSMLNEEGSNSGGTEETEQIAVDDFDPEKVLEQLKALESLRNLQKSALSS